jgi:hypothetical protein
VVTEPAVTSTVDDRSAEPADQAPASRTAQKPAAKKPAAKKPAAKKPAAKKPAAKKARAKRAPVKRAPARRAPAKRSVARSRASRSRAAGARRPTSFKVGDKVVHPHHGAAVITKRVDQEIVGETRSYFVLQIATEQLTVFVPVDTIDQTIRPVISKTAAGKVLRIFKEDPQASGKNWSRWYKVLNEKMTSGGQETGGQETGGQETGGQETGGQEGARQASACQEGTCQASACQEIGRQIQSFEIPGGGRQEADLVQGGGQGGAPSPRCGCHNQAGRPGDSR